MGNQIVTYDDKKQLLLPGATWTAVGLIADEHVTEEEWEEVGDLIGEVSKRSSWATGDFYKRKTESGWGDTYEDCEERFGISEKTARNNKYTCDQIEMSRRRDKLSFKHHSEVAPLPKRQQEKWLNEAEKEGWSASELRKRIKAEKPAVVVDEEPGKYRVIYADPPWKYGDEKGSEVTHGSAKANYPLMEIEELCEMNVSEISASNAVLFMWTTAPILAESMPVVDAWGFKYKTHIVWDKGRPFYGHYSHVQHEVLMICTRGSCTPADDAQLPKSIIAIDRQGHSRKPDEFYEIIETLYPGGEKVELFARRERDGWTSWGNEI